MKSSTLFNQLIKNGFGPFIGVPCSLVKGLINLAEESKDIDYYIATSEGEAMGIAAGFSFSDRYPTVILQNDGFGNTINPLSSLQLVYDLPTLMMITWRGEPGEKPDAIQHEIMGKVMLDLLKLFDIPYRIIEDDEQLLKENLSEAKEYLQKEKKPFALIVRRGLLDADADKNEKKFDQSLGLRMDYIKLLSSYMGQKDVVLATTGYTGREVMQEITNGSQFYMAGSMGCITSVCLGISREHINSRIFVLDGDGALLMKMGTLATLGYYKPQNVVHVVFDNGVYESTGNQSTVSSVVNFPQVALNCGYDQAISLSAPEEFSRYLNDIKEISGLLMCHVRIKPGTIKNLARPGDTPSQQSEKFMKYLRKAK